MYCYSYCCSNCQCKLLQLLIVYIIDGGSTGLDNGGSGTDTIQSHA